MTVVPPRVARVVSSCRVVSYHLLVTRRWAAALDDTESVHWRNGWAGGAAAGQVHVSDPGGCMTSAVVPQIFAAVTPVDSAVQGGKWDAPGRRGTRKRAGISGGERGGRGKSHPAVQTPATPAWHIETADCL